MHPAITDESIQKANALFWEQMLAMQLNPLCEEDGSASQSRCIGVEHLVGNCTLSGAWSGRIEVRLSRGLALEATSAMLMLPPESVQPEDTLDATKEIANMIAGTLKSALPRPCAMSVPSAEIQPGDFCILPRTHDSVTAFFGHNSGELMVRVWEEAPVTAAEKPPAPDLNAPQWMQLVSAF